MTDSIPPRRSDLEALEGRMGELERIVREHKEASDRRHVQRELELERQGKIFEQQRGVLETIADKLNALVRDQEETRKHAHARDLEWQEEKGALLGQMARDARLINGRFDQLDQNDIAQNSKISRIEQTIDGVREAANIVLAEARERQESEKRRDAALKRIETYCKVFVALAAVIGFFWRHIHALAP